jgi:tetratricopeptide (TPR) repeat protein
MSPAINLQKDRDGGNLSLQNPGSNKKEPAHDTIIIKRRHVHGYAVCDVRNAANVLDISIELLGTLSFDPSMKIKDINAQIGNVTRLTASLLSQNSNMSAEDLFELEEIHIAICKTLAKKAKGNKTKSIRRAQIAMKTAQQDLAEKRMSLQQTHNANISFRERSREATFGSAEMRATAKKVPIDAIFKAEFGAIILPQEKQEETKKKYEQYVSGIMNSVSVYLGFGDASKADRKALADAVNKADEKELFMFVSEVFNKDFKPSFEKGKVLAVAVNENTFNCYSSTTLLADALERLGKETNIIYTPNHVLVAGKEYAFDTTWSSDKAILTKEQCSERYEGAQETDTGKLLAMACEWSGIICYDRGDNKAALKYFINAVRVNPKSADAFYGIAFVFSNMGRIDSALNACDKTLKVNPMFVPALQLSGNICYKKGNYDAALENYRSALKINPINETILNDAGLAFYAKKEYEKASQICDIALEINPKDTQAQEIKGEALMKLGKLGEAHEQFRKVLEAHPDSPYAQKRVELTKRLEEILKKY